MNEFDPAGGASADGRPSGPDGAPPVGEPGERSAEFPYNPSRPVERPAELPDVRPNELPEVRPADVPDDPSPSTPQQQPVEHPDERPSEVPADVPEEPPAEVPGDRPAEAPAELPAERPEESTAEGPDDQPAKAPDEGPGEGPGRHAHDLGARVHTNGGPVVGLGEPHGDPTLAARGRVAVGGDLFELTDDADLDGALEALLLVVDTPTEEELLCSALDQPRVRIRQALDRLATGYAAADRGIDLRQVGGGWRFYTRDRYAPYVEKLLLDGQRAKLTRAALETLAVIAYRQPVTRARVAAVRGVNVDGVIRTLIARGLIEETGTDSDTGGFLYRTTELFLERLGLSSLEDLPPIAPLLPEVDAIDDV